jgi:hypothetical protein
MWGPPSGPVHETESGEAWFRIPSKDVAERPWGRGGDCAAGPGEGLWAHDRPRHRPFRGRPAMSEPADPERQARRNRLLARILIVLLGLLVLAYVIPLFIRR